MTTKKKTSLVPGSIIKVTDETQLKILDVCRKDSDAAETAFNLAGHSFKNAQAELWRCLHAFYPETEKFGLSYNHTANEIMVKYRLKEGK